LPPFKKLTFTETFRDLKKYFIPDYRSHFNSARNVSLRLNPSRQIEPEQAVLAVFLALNCRPILCVVSKSTGLTLILPETERRALFASSYKSFSFFVENIIRIKIV